MQASDLNKEILLVDKPKGITSYDVIRRLKRMMKESGLQKLPKIGHAGTLDPMATGLMIIGIGQGTKKLNEYLKLPKTYEAEITFGTKTDTGDITGTILEEKTVFHLDEEKIKNALTGMIGKLDLPVSIYSALKKDGKPLYQYAREGKAHEVEIPIRTMIIDKAELLSFDQDKNILKARFDVGSGTYIRSLTEELGKRLGTIATLSELRRTRIGEYTLEHAEKI